MDLIKIIDLIKYPTVSDKASKLLELKQYTFAVDSRLHKNNIKNGIEYLFKVKVISINTHNSPFKYRRVRKFLGAKSRYKKAIVKLAPGNFINLFSKTT